MHYGSFALFALSTVHSLAAGTDSSSPVFVAAVVGTCGLVTVLTALRILRSVTRPDMVGQPVRVR